MDEEIEVTYYRLSRHCLRADGTIVVRVSLWTAETHMSAVHTVLPDTEDYPFWRWLIEHPDFQRRIKGDELAEARLRFDFELGLDVTVDRQHSPDANQ